MLKCENFGKIQYRWWGALGERIRKCRIDRFYHLVCDSDNNLIVCGWVPFLFPSYTGFTFRNMSFKYNRRRFSREPLGERENIFEWEGPLRGLNREKLNFFERNICNRKLSKIVLGMRRDVFQAIADPARRSILLNCYTGNDPKCHCRAFWNE